MGTATIYLFFMVGMVFILSFVRNSTFIAKRANKFYCYAIIVNIFSYAGYIFRDILAEKQLVLLANLDEIVIYVGSALIAFFLLLCNCRKNGRAYKAAIITQIIYIIMCVASVFTGWLFVIDETGKYSRGPLSTLAFVYAGILEIVWVIYLLREYRSAVLYDKVKIVLVALIELIAIAIQVVDSTYKYSLLGSSFFIILFYIFLIEVEGKYDKMTKVYNQGFYSIAIGNLVNNYSIIVFDINGLKSVNDNLGHEYGDKLIKGVADSLKEGAGEKGSVYRIGGDEFVMLVRTTSQEVLDEIIAEIKKLYVQKAAELGFEEMSTSIGTAINTTEMDYTNLFRLADAGMYKDKSEYYTRTGKDRRSANRK